MKIDGQEACIQFGKVVRSLREDLGFSQEAFADLCGMHRTYMGSIERGERNVSLKNITRIAEAFNMKPSEIFEKSGL